MEMKLEDVEDNEAEKAGEVERKDATQDSRDSEADKADSFLSMWEVCLPLIQLMRVMGKYLGTPPKLVSPTTEVGTLSKVSAGSVLWCSIMTFLYFISALRFILVLVNLEKDFAHAVSEITTFLVFFLNFLMGIWMIFANRRLPSLLQNMDTYHRLHRRGRKNGLMKFKRMNRIFMLIGLMGTMLASYLFIYMGSASPDLQWLIHPYENTKGTSNLVLRLVIAASVSIFVVGYMSITSLFVPLAMILCGDFQIFNDELRLRLSTKPSSVSAEEMEGFRGRWEELCSLVGQTNSVYECYILTSYVYTFTTVCLIAYGLVQGALTLGSTAFVLGICSFCIVDSCLVTLKSVRLHVKAHAPKDYLLKIKLDNLSEKTVQIINVFIGRLTGPSIGFSVYGLFTIDVSAILTLVSTMIAYVIVILQFKSGESACCAAALSPSPWTSNWTLTTAAN